MNQPKRGNFLIAEPFLLDNYFSRSVILLCEHENEIGTVGFMINRILSEKLDDFFPELNEKVEIPIYFGGPVHPERLHFIHSLANEIEDGLKIADGLFWGGNFEKVKELLMEDKLDISRIKFFLGYSGWEKNQLADEMKENTWIVSDGAKELIFSDEEDTTIWKQSLKKLGGDYAQMSNYPIHPSLN